MKNKKRWLALGLVGIMTLGCFAGCGSKSDGKSADGKGDSSKGSVYYLNFKPEQDEQWQQLAKDYTKETGVDVTVVTAASGNYETTLMSEMGKSGAPTLFQVNGPVGLANWKDYCYDLSDSDIYKELTSDDYALKDGDSVAGIGYVIETYGIITNKPLLKEAGKELGEELKSVELSELQIPYVTNVTAEYVSEIDQTKALLAKQVAASVRWQQSIEKMLSQGVDTFIEIGPGRTLTGFMRKISREVRTYNISTVEDLKKVVNELCKIH